MGKTAQKAAVQQSHVLGHGQGGKGGSKVKNFRGQPHVHGTLWQETEAEWKLYYYYYYEFWDGPNLGLYALDFSPFCSKGILCMMMHHGPMRPI